MKIWRPVQAGSDIGPSDHPFLLVPGTRHLSTNCQIHVTFYPEIRRYPDIKLEFRGMISDYSVGGSGEQEPIFGGSGGNHDDGSGSG
jgi:hypothetical protein